MDDQHNNAHPSDKTLTENEPETAGSIGEVELDSAAPESHEAEAKPGFFDALRRSFENSWRTQSGVKKPSREERRKDKTRTLIALVAFVGMMILMFVLVFSSPPKPPAVNHRPPGTPDLGRRVTPGEGGPHDNVTPLMSVNAGGNEAEESGQATAEEVARTARPIRGGPGSEGSGSSVSGSPSHTLADIDFQDRALQQQYAMHGTNPPPVTAPEAAQEQSATDDLKAPSLVFVSAPKEAAKEEQPQPIIQQNPVTELLPAGAHLVARLEAPVSTALDAPAVAVIEYNYEQDGQIILPAGTRVIGKLRSATPQGYVSIEFNRLEFQDGTMQKLAASAMGLDYQPLKGHVTGRNRGLRFLVQSLTGVGEIGAYMVGGSPGSTSVFSEDALLREQLAANMAMAGQEQFNELATTQHIAVTVPGNTRFYLLFEQGTAPESEQTGVRPVSNSSSVPSPQELMELMDLKRELATAAAQQAGSRSVQSTTAGVR
jgi:type IV secretory pathway VirB10-like protein